MDKTCKNCVHFHPGDSKPYRGFGICKYPIPRWLRNISATAVHEDHTDCLTWDMKMSELPTTGQSDG